MPTGETKNGPLLAGLPRIGIRVGTPDERDAARNIFEQLAGNRIDEYQDLVTGYYTPEIYKALLDAHLMLVASEAPDKPAKRPEKVSAVMRRLAADARKNPLTERDVNLASDQGGVQRRLYRVTVTGPMRPQWADQFEELGVTIASFEPPFTYNIWLNDDELAKVSTLEFVQRSPQRYSLEDTLSPEFVNEYETATKGGDQTPKLFDLTVHEPNQLPRVKSIVENIGGQVTQESGKSLRFSAPISGKLVSLADRDEVKLLSPFKPVKLAMDIGREILGLPVSVATWPWDGSDEIVAVIDSGVDSKHPGFSRPDGTTRVKSITLVGGDPGDSVGHGTHVAGIIAGCCVGTAIGHKCVVGMAPGACIISVRIVDDSGEPVLDPDLTNMLERAANEGAKIINMSWASRKINSRYDTYSESVDAFVHDHPEVLVVIAAGNEGTAPTGFPLYGSAGTPATAKNALTVGACQTNRGGFSMTWGTYRPHDFPRAPFADIAMAGDCLYVAGTSSRGPTETDAIKPDVVAPGTFILSLRASGNVMPDAKGVTTPDSYIAEGYDKEHHLFLHGTSMAAPFVSGAAAVLRHYLRAARQLQTPSAALLKAILCASVARIKPTTSPKVLRRVGYPDFDQGFGRPDLSAVIPVVTDGGSQRVAFVDVANDSDLALLSRQSKDGHRRSVRMYTLEVLEGPLVVVLAWTDLPGRGLQNVLQLDVQNLQSEIQVVGNHEHKWKKDHDLPSAGDEKPVPYDRTNNVQVVSLDRVPAGTYRITVRADNTPIPGEAQGYALCARGNLTSELKE
jgi:serine protease AprX